MNIKQKIALGVVAGATVLTGAYGVSTATAATATAENFSPLVQRMVEKFNLNKDEVRSLMTEDRAARQAERENELKTKLSEAVTAGKITEAQKTKILAKHEEIQAKREALRSLEREEKRTQMQALRAEMQELLKAEGIDSSVMPEPQGPRGGGRGQGFGGGMHRSN